MDARVNDFFNEINEIVPPVTKVRSTSECVWQECFDDTSGYPYYWNMHTNLVTWEMPPEYQAWLDKTKVSKTIPHESTDTNSKGPLFPSVTKSSQSAGETKTITATKSSSSSNQDVKKISLLSAYSVDSDHDSREANSLSRNGSNTNSPFHSSRANSDAETVDEVKPTLGFSLLANYGNYSDEEEEDSHDESQDAPKTPQTETHSTLFPVTKPIDVKQFTQETNDKELPQETEEIDVKAFKRKRRIGVHLVNHPKREVIIETKTDTTETSNAENLKKKFSMNFIQGDTLQPTISSNSNDEESNDSDMVATQTTLKEKLTFLCEGKDAISPVQIMSIQLEILFIAWKSGNLNTAYFSSWIKDVSSNLIKLEEDATPEGWNLEWDRYKLIIYFLLISIHSSKRKIHKNHKNLPFLVINSSSSELTC